MTRTLAWFDVSAGVAGDMLCGALVDPGAPLAVLPEAADAVVPGEIHRRLEIVSRAGLRASLVTPERITDEEVERT